MNAASWNPLRCAGTALPVPLLLMAKLLALVLAVNSTIYFAVAAVPLLLNRLVPVSSILLGLLVLLGFGYLDYFAAALLIVIPVLPLLKARLSMTMFFYCGSGLLLATAAFPTLTFAIFVALLALSEWPLRITVIYDGDCGICNKIRRAWMRFDFDQLFHWAPFQSGIGEQHGIERKALEEKLHIVADDQITSGFRACKRMLACHPTTWILLTLALLAAPPMLRVAVMAIAACFFFPLFEPIGEAAYNWVARNRYRLSSEGACALDAKE
ncbi:MAG: DUF393 domain-containing protein [Acidimicrobiia bacterium]|nr:DUF393 domain-containing protein [Acidimicrobiia bacterium]